ncbi:MAG: DUF4035 domain-containing protein [Candidatus Reddybacter sp.]
MQRLPSELARDCTSAEYTYLQKYYQIEPFGTWRDNFHAAQITQILANVNRKPRSKVYAIKDFFFRDVGGERNKRHKSFFSAFKALAKKPGSAAPKNTKERKTP